MRDFAIGFIASDVTSQFAIFVLHRSIIIFRPTLLIVLVAQFTAVLHFGYLVSCNNFLRLFGPPLGELLLRNLKYFRNMVPLKHEKLHKNINKEKGRLKREEESKYRPIVTVF